MILIIFTIYYVYSNWFVYIVAFRIKYNSSVYIYNNEYGMYIIYYTEPVLFYDGHVWNYILYNC